MKYAKYCLLLGSIFLYVNLAFATNADSNSVFIARAKYTEHNNVLFYYSTYTHMAYHLDGKFEYIPSDSVMKIDVPYLKLHYADDFFILEENESELLELARRNRVDIQALVHNALQKEPMALYALFDMWGTVDGAAAEEYVILFWGIITRWTDEELVSLIKGLYPSQRIAFLDYLADSYNTFPIPKPLEYYKAFYPSLYTQIAIVKY